MSPADRLRQGVIGYPIETVAAALTDVLHLELVGARLVALWALEGPDDEGAPPLTDAQVDAILARLRARLT